MKYILAWYQFDADFPRVIVGDERRILAKLTQFQQHKIVHNSIAELIESYGDEYSIDYDESKEFSDEYTFAIYTIDGREVFVW